MIRTLWRALLAFGWMTGGCSGMATDPAQSTAREPRTTVQRSSTDQASPTPAQAMRHTQHGATDHAQPKSADEAVHGAFTDKLREISMRFGSNLTPAQVASILGNSTRSGPASTWLVNFDGTCKVEMQADNADAPVRWLEFSFPREFGLILEQLLPIYGDRFNKVEGTKHGTNIFFETPRPGSVTPGTRVAARLWSRVAKPNAEVVDLHLLRD